MKNYTIKTKFDDCKNLREVLDLISNSFFEKASYYLLNIWIFYPLLMMLITYKFYNEVARNIMFYILIFIGMSGILISIIYTLKKFYKTKQFDIKKYLPYILGIIFLVWCLITCFFSIDKGLSYTGDLYRREGIQTYLLYGGIFSLGILLKDEKLRNKLFNNLIFVEIIMAIIALLNNSFTYDLMHNQEPYTGVFSQFNHYGYYLMFGVLISVFKFLNSTKTKEKIMYITSYGLLLYTLLMNDTFGCFLAILGTLILILIYYIFIVKNVKKFIPILIVFILLSCVTFRNNVNIVYKNLNGLFNDALLINDSIKNKDSNKINNIGTSRGILWKNGLKYIGERPLTGYGIETIQIKYNEDNVKQSRPHNILIQMAVFTGIPGLLLYISFIGTILYRSIKKMNKLNKTSICALFIVISYLISSMFANSMFYTSPYFFIFLGILASNTFYLKRNFN